ncbi:MAG: Hint domain-containing protein [Verrucomicrobiae bacterium]|nr:Hint domain-containing protein [Verrucomicrobiae bacterium]
MVRLRVVQDTGSTGNTVVYEGVYQLENVETPGLNIEVAPREIPLAGGLTPFDLRIFNRGYAPMYVVTTRGGGAMAGDLYIAVKDATGQEVCRTQFAGSPPGTIFYNGVGYLEILPGSSQRVAVPDVFVPEALAGKSVTFEAVVQRIFDRYTSENQQAAGPISGRVTSRLVQTPYFGTARTDRAIYVNETPIVITGQAIDRTSLSPVPFVPLKIGFGTKGYKWYEQVETDRDGNYVLTYLAPQGLCGELNIWAAHPDVVDQLNQVRVGLYRFYLSPQRGDLRMAKNDSLDFALMMINPGEIPLTGFRLDFAAYRVVGTNLIETHEIAGQMLIETNFVLGSKQRVHIPFKLTATENAPDNALVKITVRSSDGVEATFDGTLSLLEPVPLVSVVNPPVGYLEVSLDRGDLLTRQLAFANRGLRDLKGVRLIPPTNVTWIQINLPRDENGVVHLPDLAVGESNVIDVVFAPPGGVPLGFHQDTIQLRGTNAVQTFAINLYVKITSSSKGAVQFYVDDILGQPVPRAQIRLRNSALQTELGPFETDLNGLATIHDLQEGEWSWQIQAPGYSANVGVVTVIPDQTVRVEPPETRLTRSLVTVSFSVVPVPYTDRYEIVIEQTFETHVPAPVLVVKPPYTEFKGIVEEFEATLIATAENHGLISIFDLTITGSEASGARLEPLIEYIPELKAQQSIQIPFRATYKSSTQRSGTQSAGMASAGNANLDRLCDPEHGLAGSFGDCISGNFIQTACGVIGLQSILRGNYYCGADGRLIGVAQGLLVAYTAFKFIFTNPIASMFECLSQAIAGLFAKGGPQASSSTGAPHGSTPGFHGTGPICFPAGTMVRMADGTCKPIERVSSGDWVRSGPGKGEIAQVLETYEREAEWIREIQYVTHDDPTSKILLQTTDEHLLWIDGKGWTEAHAVHAGDRLVTDDGGYAEVVSTSRIHKPSRVYAIKLKNEVAFFAGGVLVHDLCGTWTPAGPVFTRVLEKIESSATRPSLER